MSHVEGHTIVPSDPNKGNSVVEEVLEKLRPTRVQYASLHSHHLGSQGLNLLTFSGDVLFLINMTGALGTINCLRF